MYLPRRRPDMNRIVRPFFLPSLAAVAAHDFYPSGLEGLAAGVGFAEVGEGQVDEGLDVFDPDDFGGGVVGDELCEHVHEVAGAGADVEDAPAAAGSAGVARRNICICVVLLRPRLSTTPLPLLTTGNKPQQRLRRAGVHMRRAYRRAVADRLRAILVRGAGM